MPTIFLFKEMVGTAHARLCPPYACFAYDPSNLNETFTLAR